TGCWTTASELRRLVSPPWASVDVTWPIFFPRTLRGSSWLSARGMTLPTGLASSLRSSTSTRRSRSTSSMKMSNWVRSRDCRSQPRTSWLPPEASPARHKCPPTQRSYLPAVAASRDVKHSSVLARRPEVVPAPDPVLDLLPHEQARLTSLLLPSVHADSHDA